LAYKKKNLHLMCSVVQGRRCGWAGSVAKSAWVSWQGCSR